MDMRIVWSDFANSRLDRIFNYYKNKASLKVARKIIQGIIKTSLTLKHQPYIGTKEYRLRHRNKDYRYIIYKNYKIIYSVDSKENSVKITDVFDTRQNPTKINQ